MPRRIKENLLFLKSSAIGNRDLMKQHGRHKDDMREARRLYKLLSFMLSTTKNKDKYNRGGGRSIFSTQQKCVTKLRYGMDKEKHARFLQEYLTQEKKDNILEKPKLFSNTDDIDNYIKKYQLKMTGKHFKFIISPESPHVDCKALVKTLVARMEKITGLQFDWLSTVHTNTAHIHAHLLINGIDKNGKDVNCFRGIFLKQTIREMSSQICTELVGERTKEQIEASIKKLPTVSRYCIIDKQIELYAISNNDEETKNIYKNKIISRDDTMYQRLCFLCELGFAQKIEGSQKSFLLEKDWSTKLKTSGRYNAYLKARSSLLFTTAADLQLFNKDTKEEVKGTVTNLFVMNDEDSWDNAVIIENKENRKAYYIPLYREPNKKLLKAQVNCVAGFNNNGGFKPIIKVTKWGQEVANN